MAACDTMSAYDTMADNHQSEPSDVPPQLEYTVRKKIQTFMPITDLTGEKCRDKKIKDKKQNGHQ